MKINKVTLNEQLKLTEADSINPQTASVDEIAAKVKADAETASNGEKTVSDAAAANQAAEIKQTAQEIGATGFSNLDAAEESIKAENALTKELDRCLEVSLKNQRRYKGTKAAPGHNLLVEGLPGSGKTAIVKDWAAGKVNFVYVNAKNNDLEAFLNGFSVRSDDERNTITKAYSNSLAGLDKPKSVLFLDEFNRQTKEQIRASLLTLMNEKCIEGKSSTGDGYRYFPNLLFTIACINPAVPTDRGAANLNDAEKSRFSRKIKFDSNIETTKDFFKKYFDKLIDRLDPKDPYYLEDLEDYLRQQDLGLFLVKSPKFHYNDQEDLQELSDTGATMFNQRHLTNGLADCAGRVGDFVDWVDNGANLLDSTADALKDIAGDYEEPSLLDLIKKHGMPIPDALKSEAEKAEKSAAETETEIEDDEDMFTDTSDSTKASMDPAAAINAINSAIAGW